MRHRAQLLTIIVALIWAITPGRGQEAPLRIVSAAPAGVLDQLSDANEVRISFSEPMVAIGVVPATEPPPWLEITPSVTGTFYWSGTKTLIVSPGPSTPLPFSTTFTVRVAASATSTIGHTLASQYVLTFTTPTPRLVDAQSRRTTGRFDDPIVLELLFNQPMDAATVLPHLRVGLRPHLWTPPRLSSEARASMARKDPTALARFDAKVAQAGRAASASDRLKVRPSTAPSTRVPPVDRSRLVIVETTSAPPPGAVLDVALAATLRGLQGPVTHAAQSTVVALGDPFLVTGTACRVNCNPQRSLSIEFGAQVSGVALVAALAITDVTDPSSPRRVERSADARPDYVRAQTRVDVSDLGFELPATARKWRLDISADLHSLDGQVLGYPWVGFVENGHASPFLAFEGTLLEAGDGAALPVSSRNYQSVWRDIGRVGPTEIMPRLIELTTKRPFTGTRDRALQRLAIEPDAIRAQGIDLRRVLSPQGVGIVALFLSPRAALSGSVRAEDRYPGFQSSKREIVQVTNLGITLKHSSPSTVVFVTRLDSGEPVAGAGVSIVDRSNRTLWRGTTDEGGAALAPMVTPSIQDSSDDLSFIVSAEKDGDVAFVTSGQHEQIDELDDDDSPTSDWQGTSFTDRGVYRLNDEMHIKTVVRAQSHDGLRMLPRGTPIDVALVDSGGQQVETRTLTLSEWGSVDWTWRVPAAARLGEFEIAVYRPNPRPESKRLISSNRVYVAEYRRPEFIVTAHINAEPPILGSTVRGDVEARYLFGATLGSRPARWGFYRWVAQRPPAAITERFPSDRYAVGYLPDAEHRKSSENPERKAGTLGPGGRLTVDLATAPDTDDSGTAYEYVFEGEIEDVSQQQIAGNAHLILHPASFYVVLGRPSFFVATATGANITLATADLSGQSIAGVPIHVALMRVEWAPPPPDRPGNGQWIRREIPAGEWTIRTAAGDTPLSVPIKDGGSYLLRATARDANGRPTRTEATFYALGPGQSTWGGDDEQLELTPERKTWKPGERARILIKSPWPRATALVTLEREGVRRHQTVAVTSTQDAVDVPITEADVPNVFVSVTLVKGRTSAPSIAEPGDLGKPAFRIGYTELLVEDASRRLQVEIAADRAEYRPRDVATVTARVTSQGGVAAHAEVTLWAMDKGLLSLTAHKTPKLEVEMYTPRRLRVRTIDSRRFLIDRTMLTIPAGVAGGTLGGLALSTSTSGLSLMADKGESNGPEQPTDIREDLRPLAFWLGSAITDSSGSVTTTVTLPELLTTYQIMAVAGDRASRFGSGEREFRVTKPLTLLPAFPRFLSSGDRASFGAIVTSTSARGTASIRIESRDPERLRIEGGSTQSVMLAPGISVPIRFDAVAGNSGAARVRIVATLNETSDRFEIPLDITLPARLQTTAAYGETTNKATEALALPSNARRDIGGLSVELASTALVGLSEPARYLAEYPYACAEQRASRALALLLAAELGDAFELPSVKPTNYRAEAADALRALARFQCNSGGFALWEGRCGAESAYLTAYVLHVLKVGERVKAGGMREIVEPALDFLERQAKEVSPSNAWWPVWATSQAYSLKVLAEFGRKTGPAVDQLLRDAERLPIVAQSYMADALAASSDRGPRYRDLVRRLANAIRIDADRAHVEEPEEATLGWLWNSNARSTAVVLEGFARRQDDVTLAAPLVRWLGAARTNGRWVTTHENAAALEAFVAYYRAFERERSTMTATVAVGATPVGTATFAAGSSSAQRVTVPMDDLMKQVSTTTSPALSISRDGSGRLYYTARVQYAAPEPVTALDRGFAIERRYEPFVDGGKGAPRTSFSAGDVVRVVLTLTVRGEARYLALTDPLPSGFEPIDEGLSTTAMDLAREATVASAADRPFFSWQRGGFDHVEKHDDRFLAFATRLAAGTHELTYLARATTAGTFAAPGARIEAMYAPELEGRSAAATVTVVPRQ